MKRNTRPGSRSTYIQVFYVIGRILVWTCMVSFQGHWVQFILGSQHWQFFFLLATDWSVFQLTFSVAYSCSIDFSVLTETLRYWHQAKWQLYVQWVAKGWLMSCVNVQFSVTLFLCLCLWMLYGFICKVNRRQCEGHVDVSRSYCSWSRGWGCTRSQYWCNNGGKQGCP